MSDVHHIVPDPDGEPVPAEGTIAPAEEELGSIADGDEIPESEEEIRQDPTPINPDEEAEQLPDEEE